MKQIDLQQYYNSEEFIRTYDYEGNDLGAVCEDGRTVFSLWSPLAHQVVVSLFEDGDGGCAIAAMKLIKGERGVWKIEVDRELHGVYYEYELTFDTTDTTVTADPYAKACGVNGLRSMVVDLRKTDPDGWEEDCPPEKDREKSEDFIYELHVKEFSWSEAGGFPEEARGTYLAFTIPHTTLNGDGIHPVGLDYLKDLGITHVQLMPVYDFGSVDEAGDKNQFNWGYDPMNYNVPEGSYSTDPAHGEVRIREMKEMVQSLHSHGFRVIMDVVYNHTFSADSWLERTVPGFYYRHKADGTLSDGSGCGNDVASERLMCSRYILNSVLYWVEEYHIDGFRFDLMGLLDVDLMNRIQKELDERYGKGEKLLYGEPWAAGPSPMEPDSVPALWEHVRELDEQIGVFCGFTRDAVKGHVFEEAVPGFVNGGDGFEESILHGVTAWCSESPPPPCSVEKREALGDRAKAPSQVITYVSAHDNLTLWDKLVVSMSKSPSPGLNFLEKEEELLRAYKLAAAIRMTCQGRQFMLSGEEFARTKEGLSDSYCAPISVNRLDWNRAYEYEELREYYRGFMALRKQLPGLCDKSSKAATHIFGKKMETKKCISFFVDNRGGEWEGPWETLWIVYHAGLDQIELKLPDEPWELLADGKSSSWWMAEKAVTMENLESVKDGYIRIEPVSVLLMGRRRAE